jgi:hypothetical protein
MKMYCLVRHDLSHAQRAVQGGHAIAQYLLENPDTEWDNGTLVFLSVLNESELRNWYNKLKTNTTCSCFIEPDIGHEMTALATVHTGDTFKELRLM